MSHRSITACVHNCSSPEALARSIASSKVASAPSISPVDTSADPSSGKHAEPQWVVGIQQCGGPGEEVDRGGVIASRGRLLARGREAPTGRVSHLPLAFAGCSQLDAVAVRPFEVVADDLVLLAERSGAQRPTSRRTVRADRRGWPSRSPRRRRRARAGDGTRAPRSRGTGRIVPGARTVCGRGRWCRSRPRRGSPPSHRTDRARVQDLAHDRRDLDQAPFIGRELVQPGGEQRRDRRRDWHIGEVVVGPIDRLQDQATLVDQEPGDLLRVEGCPSAASAIRVRTAGSTESSANRFATSVPHSSGPSAR